MVSSGFKSGSKGTSLVKALLFEHRLPWRYKKFIRDMPVYIRGIYKKKKYISKFIIFAQGRSGTELLRSLLNCHKEIYCDNEILSGGLTFPSFYMVYLNGKIAKSNKKNYGFKLKITHIRDIMGFQDINSFLKKMYKSSWKIIYLRRENIFREALSSIICECRNKFSYTLKDKILLNTKINIDCKKLISKIKEREINLKEESIALSNIPHLEIIYERDLLDQKNHQKTADSVFNFLGVGNTEVKTFLIRSSKDDISEYVDNYNGVIKVVKDNGYGKFLY